MLVDIVLKEAMRITILTKSRKTIRKMKGRKKVEKIINKMKIYVIVMVIKVIGFIFVLHVDNLLSFTKNHLKIEKKLFLNMHFFND